MIMRGIEACGREWRSVLQFMKDHADILGEAGIVYKIVRSDDKLMHDQRRSAMYPISPCKPTFSENGGFLSVLLCLVRIFVLQKLEERTLANFLHGKLKKSYIFEISWSFVVYGLYKRV